MPGAHKIGAAISGPRIADGNFMDITLFLRIWDVPGILPGCPRVLGVLKKFVQKTFVCIFRSLKIEKLKIALRD